MRTVVEHRSGNNAETRGFFGDIFIDRFRALLPFHMTWALALTATLLYYFATDPQAVGISLTIAAVLAGIGIRLANLRYVENQTFGFLVVIVSYLWLMVVYFLQPTLKFSGISLGTLAAGFGLFYALDRRSNTRIKVSEKTRSWARDENRQERAKVKTTKWLEYEEKPFGWEGVLGWVGSSNLVEDIIKNRARLEAEWGEREGTLTIEKERDPIGNVYTDRVRCRCVQTNPLADTVPWDGAIADSITSSKTVAVYGDAKTAELSLWEPGVGGAHMLFAGASRSGKSVAMKHQIVTWGAARDGSVIITLCDLKGGTSFLKFAPMAAWTVVSIEGALQQLEALALITVARGAYIASRSDWGESWEPGPGYPVIVAFFDEVSMLLDKDVESTVRNRATAAIKVIARMGMGTGVLMRLGVQDPTKESTGSMQILTQLVYRVAFRLQYTDRAKYCVPKLASQGVEPANIRRDRRGSCYIEDGVLDRTEMARWVGVSAAQENRVIREYWMNTPDFADCDFGEINGASARPALEARKVYTIADIPPGSDEDEGDAVEIGGYSFDPPTRRLPEGVEPDAAQTPIDLVKGTQEAIESPRVSDASSDAAGNDRVDAEGRRRATLGASAYMRHTLVDELHAARPDGVSVNHLRDACERTHRSRPSRTWVNSRLKEWREQSPPLVELRGKGSYVWVFKGASTPVDKPVEQPAPRRLTVVRNEEDE